MNFACKLILIGLELLIVNKSFALQDGLNFVDTLKFLRVRRQAGYVYKRPSVSFELPQRQNSISTQAPTVDRTQAQQMYYAYPAPTTTGAPGPDSVNIGFSAPSALGSTTGTTASSTAFTMTTGISSTGYPINSPSAGTFPSTTLAPSSTTSASGYNYNSPSTGSTVGSNFGGSSAGVSTNAPKYLPPIGGGTVGVSSTGSAGSIVGPSSTGTSSSVATTATSTRLSDSYIPPSASPSTPANLPSVTTVNVPNSPSTQSSTTALQSSTFNGYIPPNPLPGLPTFGTPSSPGIPSSSPFTPGVSPPALTSGYLPPNSPTAGTTTSGYVSTPAPTYLPPVL